MSNDEFGEGLLDGPRGRRLCLNLVMSTDPSLWTPTIQAARDPANADLVGDLVQRIAAFEPPVAWADAALMEALAASTDAARYWQEPDEEDLLLQHPQLRSALERVSGHVSGQSATGWWSSPLAAGQQFVQWTDQSPLDSPPALTGAAGRLDRWKVGTVESERRAARRPKPVEANFSGEWWSTPAMAGLVTTTRSLPGLGAVKLMLVEDGFGWTTADVWPLEVPVDCRTYEITGARAWIDLVLRYPMDVTFSRRHDWWRSGGHDGSWLLPDWSAVASEFDAVHLTVTGYLTTAGRALPAGGARTMLAGWNADETYWLGDVLEHDGDPVSWLRETSQWSDGSWRAAR
ncbi:MAG TPA: hypothetical protein VFT01_08310 [Homoserinimonas sp.]|nr:hypothetical protein [Homoserinimonas sp.]